MVKALIVDDEPRAVRNLAILLEKYCNEQVEVVGSANNIKEAYTKLIELRPELIFLDINMPGGTGLELFEKIRDLLPIKVIFVTAYQEYAIKALRLSALDYLLKPVDRTELVAAVNRIKSANQVPHTLFSNLIERIGQNKKPTKIGIKTTEGLHVVDIANIVYLSSDKNYTTLHVDDADIVSSKPIGEYESLLEECCFVRVHRSFLINCKRVKEYRKRDQKVVFDTGHSVEVSRSKKDLLLEKLEKL